MAKKRKTQKQRRKELLKEEDAFIDAASQSIEWVDKHKNLVIFGTIGLASMVALAWGGVQINEQARSVGAASLRSALTVLAGEVVADEATANPDGDPPTFVSDEARLKAGRAALGAVVDSGGSVGTLAKFYAIDAMVELGEKERAVTELSALVKGLSANDSLYFLAVERLAFLQESIGQVEQAIASLEKLRAGTGSFYGDVAALEVARMHLAQGRTEQAREVLTVAKRDFPTSSMNSAMEGLLKELGGAKALAVPEEAEKGQ